MINKVSAFGRVCLFIFCCTFSFHAAFASTQGDQAKQVLEKTISEVLAELKKPELKDPSKKDAILEKVEDIILQLFDIEELSVRTVGPLWKSFSPEQKKDFETNFSLLLRKTYLEKLDGYSGQQVTFTGEQVSPNGDKVEIQTTVPVNGKDTKVDYRMLSKNGRWVVYDIIIEGVSMVQNYRSQFQDILLKGNIDGLIKLIKDKVEAMSQNKQ